MIDIERWKEAWIEHRRMVRADECNEPCGPNCTTLIELIYAKTQREAAGDDGAPSERQRAALTAIADMLDPVKRQGRTWMIDVRTIALAALEERPD